jgi:hypothetical protein
LRKKISHIERTGLLLLLLFAGGGLGAQVTISVAAANITSTTPYAVTLASGSCNGVGLGTSIRIQGSSPIFAYSGGGSLLVNNFVVQLVSINGLSLLASTPAIDLSTSPQTIYTVVLGTGGAIHLSYTVPMSGYAWAAGTYTTSPTYALVNSTGTASYPGQLIIAIPAFITAPAPLPTFTLNVNNLNHYSSSTVAVTGSMAISSTVPYRIGVRANTANFTYSNALGLATPSNLSVGGVAAALNTGASVNLSASTQNLNATAVAVSAGNNQTQTVGFSILPASLLNQFVQTGTYTVPLTFTTSDASASPTVGNQTTTSTLTVNVADMQSFVVNDAITTITLASATDYQGVSQAQPNHLTVSSTSPWNIAVKTAAPTLSDGTTTIPAGLISVGNTSGQTLLTTTALSTTNQTITSSQPAAVGKTVGVLYSISAANAAQLVGKARTANDTYTTTVTYTLTAL